MDWKKVAKSLEDHAHSTALSAINMRNHAGENAPVVSRLLIEGNIALMLAQALREGMGK